MGYVGPSVASVDRELQVRIIENGTALASYQRYYLASSMFAGAHPQIIQMLFDQLKSAGGWLLAHQQQAAALLAPSRGSTPRQRGR